MTGKARGFFGGEKKVRTGSSRVDSDVTRGRGELSEEIEDWHL